MAPEFWGGARSVTNAKYDAPLPDQWVDRVLRPRRMVAGIRAYFSREHLNA